jgi:UDP-N-acetylmuramoyl-L-alanyl-D-glutamate--2,6-diaminopimelate ligase
LSELTHRLADFRPRLSGDGAIRVAGLCQDSRRIEAGEVFAVRGGASADGATFIDQALERGARALLVERRRAPARASVPTIEVDQVAPAIAYGAEAAFGDPSRGLKLVGVTGTNGKTTVCTLLRSVLTTIGSATAQLGTLGYDFGDESVPGSLTTPEADAISRLLSRALAKGATHAVMEASSHALAQARVDALLFAVAAFTNLTHDHLDYHGSMQAYFAAKDRLFTELSPQAAVVNVDDEHGFAIAERVPSHLRLLCVSRRKKADVYPLSIESDVRGIRGKVKLPSGTIALESPLVGEHNLENLLLVLGVVEALGLDARLAAAALASAPSVPGRLERCDEPTDELPVLVDYAHTPDALARALAAVRPLVKGRLICVFGCGGDRDPGKRPVMGRVVAAGADYAVVTNDNPRSEAPEKIATAIEAGLRERGGKYEVELERATAIERAVLTAEPGDVVLIAGKGHEDYQIIGSDRRHFDDREQARAALAKRRALQQET